MEPKDINVVCIDGEPWRAYLSREDAVEEADRIKHLRDEFPFLVPYVVEIRFVGLYGGEK